MICKYFLLFQGSLFILSNLPCCEKAFGVDKFHLFAYVFGVNPKHNCQEQYQEALSLCFLLGVLKFQALLENFNQFWLIFVSGAR